MSENKLTLQMFLTTMMMYHVINRVSINVKLASNGSVITCFTIILVFVVV